MDYILFRIDQIIKKFYMKIQFLSNIIKNKIVNIFLQDIEMFKLHY
jgi:hypothetical protein